MQNQKEKKSMPNVIGMFEDASQAQQAVERLTNNHIAGDKIKLLGRDSREDGSSGKQTPGTGTRGASAANAGQFVGGFIDMGVPQGEATSYEEQIRKGKVLVTVRAANDTEADRVANLMDVEGAVEVEGAGERGNAEAAPGYEGARADETDETARGREQRRNPRAGQRRIRVYGS
jgi:hypothetical protein